MFLLGHRRAVGGWYGIKIGLRIEIGLLVIIIISDECTIGAASRWSGAGGGARGFGAFVFMQFQN